MSEKLTLTAEEMCILFGDVTWMLSVCEVKWGEVAETALLKVKQAE